MLSFNLKSATLLAFTATTLFGFIYADMAGSKDLFRCRQSCYQKFVQDWHHCMDFEDCKNCWNNCDQQLGPFSLNINSALRQGSLVITDIGWDQAITNASKQCLVTWEVSGGGLMGNLLTDSSTVELSLWLDTVYHVQVTCKHKETGGMRRSYKLIVDTHKLSDAIASSMQAIELDTGISKTVPSVYGGAEHASSAETDSRMRILKDSSKDFLTPYNPNAEVVKTSSAPSSLSSSSSSSSSTSTTSKTMPKIDSSLPDAEDHINSVLRTKLTAALPSLDFSESQQFLTQSIVFAGIGSVVLFFGLIVLYLLTRSVRKEVALLDADNASMAGSIDKEVLIHSEMLPSQTHAAHAQTQTHPAAVHIQTQTDTRTLHV